MRMTGRAAAGLGVGALGAVAAVPAGLGWLYSSLLLDPTPRPVFPERVLAVGPGTVSLAPTRLARQPGTWGLRFGGGPGSGRGLAAIGPVAGEENGAVVRPLLGGETPVAGDRAVLDTGPWEPDPAARGLAFDEVAVATPLGAGPAWWVPARGDTWAVLVHGRGGSRREALRVLPALHALGLDALVVSYRNDPEAPASPDGRYHLGDTEWLDVEAAIAFALAHGAARVVLYGWSMGAAIIGALLDRSALAGRVVAVVWDAPLVDWRATLSQQARNRRLPPGLVPIACAVTIRRIGIDLDRFDLRRRPPAVRPPTLLVHTTDDTAVPVGPSRALATAAPGLGWPMTYVEVAGVEHTGAWNADPVAYEEVVVEFLARWTT